MTAGLFSTFERWKQANGLKAVDNREAGFTLLEVMVALGILAMSLSILLGVFTATLDRMQSDQTRATAEHLAETLLLQAQTADPAALADRAGTVQPGIQWTVTIRPYGTPDDRNAWKNVPVRILVQVKWSERGHSRTVLLSTLKLAQGTDHA